MDTIKRSAPSKSKNEPAVNENETEVQEKPEKKTVDYIGVKCSVCRTPMKVPLKVLKDKTELPVKCPNKECGKITRLKKSVKPPEDARSASEKKFEENMNYGD
ncbi:MAG: hypothetical protein R2681_10085 [Pyrinomonadaceae bacterium]